MSKLLRARRLAHRIKHHEPPLAPLLLLTLATMRPRGVFCQIGSNDGEKFDPLRLWIERSRWSGVLVEPVPYVYERLASRYADHPRVSLENVAVGEVDGTATFYALREPAAHEAGSLPRYYDALGSFRRDVILSHTDRIPDIEDRIMEISVETVTFDTLCARRRIEALDLLHIDTEGYDLEILRTVDLGRYQPRLLIFEVAHLDEEQRQEAAELLSSNGYIWHEEHLDWWCVSTSHRDATQRGLLAVARWIAQLPSDRHGPRFGSARRRLSAAGRILRDGPPPTPRQVTDTADAVDLQIAERVRPLTLTTPERVLALLDSVAHVVEEDLPGAFVECGVWRGGSVLAMALKLLSLGAEPRDLYLYDTFTGMTEPGAVDTSLFDPPAIEEWGRSLETGQPAYSEYFADAGSISAEAVVGRLVNAGYPAERVHVVAGPVEETIPGTVPDRIALLRLDTDWYESTMHELVHLYPLLSTGGVLLIDDYGHWDGARRAVDEYLALLPRRPMLHRADYTMRVGTKP